MKTTPSIRVPDDDLRLALEQALSQYFARRCPIKILRRRRSIYSSSCCIENLEVELARGGRLSLVFKDLSPTALLVTAQEVRPQFFYDPLREIETYRTVLDPGRFGTAVCYGAIHHPESQRYWLFLERVRGPLLWQVGKIETWRRAAQWIARLHTEFSLSRNSNPGNAGITTGNKSILSHKCHTTGIPTDRPVKTAVRPSHLLNYDRQLFGLWLDRADRFLHARRAAQPATVWRQFRHVANRYNHVIDRLVTLPRTFIHGEFYPSNIILRDAASNNHICPIDWEAAAIAPGLIDLTALTSGDWTPDQRQDLVSAYHEALEPADGWPPEMPELLELVDYCQLHLAMQWLGWAADWSPPKMHAHNWLNEVLRLAKRLRL
jgi:hypothetical protein